MFFLCNVKYLFKRNMLINKKIKNFAYWRKSFESSYGIRAGLHFSLWNKEFN